MNGAQKQACGQQLVDEDDTGGALLGHGKELLDQALAVTHILGHQVAGGDGEEGGLRLACNSLHQQCRGRKARSEGQCCPAKRQSCLDKGQQVIELRKIAKRARSANQNSVTDWSRLFNLVCTL